MTELTREQKLQLIWRHTHRDYRGTMKGVRNILVLRRGGTTLVPLSDLTDAEIADRLPRALRREADRKAKP